MLFGRSCAILPAAQAQELPLARLLGVAQDVRHNLLSAVNHRHLYLHVPAGERISAYLRISWMRMDASQWEACYPAKILLRDGEYTEGPGQVLHIHRPVCITGVGRTCKWEKQGDPHLPPTMSKVTIINSAVFVNQPREHLVVLKNLCIQHDCCELRDTFLVYHTKSWRTHLGSIALRIEAGNVMLEEVLISSRGYAVFMEGDAQRRSIQIHSCGIVSSYPLCFEAETVSIDRSTVEMEGLLQQFGMVVDGSTLELTNVEFRADEAIMALPVNSIVALTLNNTKCEFSNVKFVPKTGPPTIDTRLPVLLNGTSVVNDDAGVIIVSDGDDSSE